MIGQNQRIRTKTIDNLVSKIKTEYSCDAGINYNKLCDDLYVTRIPSKKVFQGILIYLNRGNHIFTCNQHKLLEEYSTAHELGHLLLFQKDTPKRIKEKEAHYFAHALTGLGIFEYYMLSLIDVAIFMTKHPLITKKFLFGDINNFLLELSKEYENAGNKINRFPQDAESERLKGVKKSQNVTIHQQMQKYQSILGKIGIELKNKF